MDHVPLGPVDPVDTVDGGAPEAPRPQLDLLDTNTVLRYMLEDDADQFTRARALIEGERALKLSLVTVAEIGFVLERVYSVARSEVVQALVELVSRRNVDTYEVPTDIVIEALAFCAPSRRVNFGDAMLWATARAAGSARVWTFDKRFLQAGVTVQLP